MNEKLLALWQKVEANIRLVTFGVFVVLLLTIIGLKSSETVDTIEPAPASVAPDMPGAPTPPGAAASPNASNTVSVILPAAEKVESVLEAPKIPIASTSFASLVNSSMFDVKEVQNTVALESQANQRFEDAMRLSGERKYREAIEVCKEVFAIRPGHLRAQELKTSIEEKLKDAGVIRAGAKPEARIPASATPVAPIPGLPGPPGSTPAGP